MVAVVLTSTGNPAGAALVIAVVLPARADLAGPAFSGVQWGETYTIDAWANLTNISGISGKTYSEGLNVSALTNNRLTSFGYDAAGNMTSNGTSTYKYDAENRLVTTAGYTYYYDGDGDRVAKVNGSISTIYWRDFGGEPLLESSLTGTNQEAYIFFNGARVARLDVAGSVVHYYFSDHLGSSSVVENATGSACEQDIDYYPYGGVVGDYCPNVPQHYRFTGKERDTESGLDNFGARYDASSLGRSMTPDWAAKPVTVPYAKFGDPQTLNLYTYVENGPVNRVDANGHFMLGGISAVNEAEYVEAAYGDPENVKQQHPQPAATGQNGPPQPAQNKSWWQKLAGIFYAKGSVGVALEVGVEAHVGKAKSPLKVGAKVGADVKSTMTVTTGGTSVSATKEAQAGVNIGKVILGPQTSTENVTVKNGVALANPEVEHSSSAMFGTERAEGTLSKGDFGVGAEIDAGVLVVGFEVGVDFDKVKDLFNPQ